MDRSQLRAYLKAMSEPERVAFAAACGTTIGHLRNCITDPGKPINPAVCVAIERHSASVVRRWHLSREWRNLWPELIKHPDAPAITIPA